MALVLQHARIRLLKSLDCRLEVLVQRKEEVLAETLAELEEHGHDCVVDVDYGEEHFHWYI